MFRSTTQQDISWFLDLWGKDQLDVDPPYQRRSVWSTRDRKFFIDTILNNYPAPPVFLHKELDDQGHQIFHVVDGKQRLQTVIDFVEGEISIPDYFHDGTLQKKHWKNLTRSAKEVFWNYTFTVEMLPVPSDLEIKGIFERLNRNSRSLTRQEMRHAKYDGWLITFVERETKKIEWKKFGVITIPRARRMNDVQFLSELCAIILDKTLHGFDQNQLDGLYATHEDIEEIPNFSIGNFSDEVEKIKNIISDLIGFDPDIKKYLKIQSHFYSLWAYLYLEQGHYTKGKNFTKKYKNFMDSAMEIVSANKAPNALPSKSKSRHLNKAKQAQQNYASGSQGASTDLAQRKMRHSGLASALNRK